jgi:predicted amidohydrolase YtcJ
MYHEDTALLHVRVMSSVGGQWRQTGDALYLRRGVITRIGSTADVQSLASSSGTRVLDFSDTPGATCYPAFTDSHLHLDLFGFSLLNINLNGTTSLDIALDRVHGCGKPDNGAWIHGDCWDDELWSARPHRHQLDDLYKSSPVVLNRKDYHSLWLNTAAMKAVGLWDSDQFGPDLVPRDAGGPTGIVHDAAQDWVLSHIPAPLLEERFRALHTAISKLLSLGFASCCSMDYTIFPELQALVAAMDGEPRVRIWQAIGLGNLDAAVSLGLRSGFGSDFLRIGGVKLFADGSLGSRTAYMQEAWPGTPGNYGYHTYESVEWLADRFRKADENSLWVWIHAIGDRATAETLDAFEQAGVATSKGHAHHRMEHAQFLRPQDIGRFADLGVAASVQPAHLDLDIGKLRTTFETPHPGSYVFKSLLQSGAELIFGSDAPVEDPDALKGIAFASFRTRSGEEPYQSGQCISVADALTAYTVAPQASLGLLGQRGNLVEGQDADVVVLSRDILHDTDPQSVRSTRVLATIVAGETAFLARQESVPRVGLR